MKNKIGIFSFFSGAGFLDLGFEKTKGFETVFVNEFHAPFVEIYKGSREKLGIPKPRFGYHVKNIENFLLEEELAILAKNLKTAKEQYAITGFIGGPPCPDFSVGGKNKGKEGENGKLSGSYADLICRTKPDFFLFENVKGLWRTKKHRQFYESLKEKLISTGYFVTEKLINAIEYGTPQDRDRIILIGFHSEFLKKNKYKDNGTSYLWDFDWNSAKKFDSKKIFNLDWPKQDEFFPDLEKPKPNNIPVELTVQHWFEKNDVEFHPNASMFFKPQAGLAKFQRILEGDDKKKSYKRLHRWRYSPTAAYGNNEVHLHPYKARRISVSEALSIQSLPKEFEIPKNVTLSNSFKAIGNGVPYLAGRGLAISLLNFISTLISDFKPLVNGEINSSKPSHLYKPVAQAEQLSVLEPQEQKPY